MKAGRYLEMLESLRPCNSLPALDLWPLDLSLREIHWCFVFASHPPPSPNAPPFLDPFSDQIYLEASEQVSSDVGCRGQSPRDGKVERWKRGSKDKQKIWRAACQLDIVLRLQSPLAALHGLQDLSAPAGN